jgi:bifunctional N-acetylglucosamine-1-phosphate-uridyltransferase/glucosamine-1-phosphate-acetyltransferase GlmU-like protein
LTYLGDATGQASGEYWSQGTITVNYDGQAKHRALILAIGPKSGANNSLVSQTAVVMM